MFYIKALYIDLTHRKHIRTLTFEIFFFNLWKLCLPLAVPLLLWQEERLQGLQDLQVLQVPLSQKYANFGGFV
jgi:hypothetical protein